MSKVSIIEWAPVTGNGKIIVNEQNCTNGIPVFFNQTNAPQNVPVPTNAYYFPTGIARTINIVGQNNGDVIVTGLSAVNADNPWPFTVQSETVTLDGVGAGTTARIYQNVISIVPQFTDTLQAGFGSSGIAGYVFMDTNRTAWYATIQGQIVNQTGLEYTLYSSLTPLQIPNPIGGSWIDFPTNPAAFEEGTASSTEDQLIALTTPVLETWASITGNTGETFYLTVVQQGLRS